MNALKNYFRLPEFPNEEQTRLANYLYAVLKYVLVTMPVIIIIAYVYFRSAIFYLTIIAFIFLFTGFILLIKGQFKPATIIVLLTLLATAFADGYITRGINDISILIYPGVIVLSALLLDRKIFVLFTVLCVMANIGNALIKIYTGDIVYSDNVIYIADLIVMIIILLLVAVSINVLFTSLVNSNKRLRLQERKLLNIFENSQDIFFELSYKGYIEEISDSVEKNLGYRTEEFIGQRLDNFIEGREKYDEFINILRENNSVKNYELQLRDKNDKPRFVLINASFTESAKSKTKKITGSILDITEKKTLEDQLVQSQKLESIGRLAGGVAHDFNNYLTVINGHSELAMRKLIPDCNKIESNLQAVHSAGRKAANLTRQLLAFSRKQVSHPRIIDPNTIISELQKMFTRVIGEDIEIKLRLKSKDKILIKADPSQLEQIFVNLLVNAGDAIQQKQSKTIEKLITIETSLKKFDETITASDMSSHPGDYFLFSISDTGIGMKQAIKNKIFDPFFTTKTKGTGLGLSTVYGIIKQNEGFINVYSEEGIGTTFKIYWPVAQGSRVDQEKQINSDDLKGEECVLLVEDDDQVRAYTSLLLSSYGYEVLEAENGLVGEEIFRKNEDKIDLIITDLVMPKVTGIELTDLIRKHNKSIEILYVSGYTNDLIAQDGILQEGVNYIQKPFSTREILIKIKALLDKKNNH